MVDIQDFNEERQCIYKEELYSVRDNGSVLRHSREDMRKRKDDDVWTFGKYDNKNGYAHIGKERVHRIVACAFIGEPPSPQHVVDHIDTNRRNNRPENLRWLTKLENVLLTPITISKIENICGSIETFIENPSILHGHEKTDQNFKWMRAVTAEEARNAFQNLSQWAKERPEHKGGSLGEWIYRPILSTKQFVSKNGTEDNSKQSLIPNAVQVNWHVPSEFPLCPQTPTNPILDYYKNLNKGEIFCKNESYTSIILDAAIVDDHAAILVMTKSDDDSLKNWALAKITYANGVYFHHNKGSFFSEDGVRKYYTIGQGKEWTGPTPIDDYM